MRVDKSVRHHDICWHVFEAASTEKKMAKERLVQMRADLIADFSKIGKRRPAAAEVVEEPQSPSGETEVSSVPSDDLLGIVSP